MKLAALVLLLQPPGSKQKLHRAQQRKQLRLPHQRSRSCLMPTHSVRKCAPLLPMVKVVCTTQLLMRNPPCGAQVTTQVRGLRFLLLQTPKLEALLLLVQCHKQKLLVTFLHLE